MSSSSFCAQDVYTPLPIPSTVTMARASVHSRISALYCCRAIPEQYCHASLPQPLKEVRMAPITKSERVPKPMEATFNNIVALTDTFCRAHLDEEYAQLARQATAALCRKRPSPLATGNLKTWACGIVYALGSANFLFDKSQTPTMRAADLCAGFGVSQSTGSAKAKAVRDALGMGQMDPQWYRPSKMEDNPLAWMIMVDGFVVDVRRMSRAVQEIAYEKGLIPL